MKTFTIRRQSLLMGENLAAALLLAHVKDNNATMFMAEKGISVAVSKKMTMFGVPLGQGLHKETEQYPEGAVLRLHNLDVVETTQGEEILPSRIVREANLRDVRALLLVDLDAGDGGEIDLFANWKREVRDPKARRIVRVPVGIEEALGVTLLATGDSDKGRRFLLSMEPGASFKLVRGGRVGPGEPHEFIVDWQGRWDQWANDDRQPQEELVRRRADISNWKLMVRARW
jgi:hypothetical protein